MGGSQIKHVLINLGKICISFKIPHRVKLLVASSSAAGLFVSTHEGVPAYS